MTQVARGQMLKLLRICRLGGVCLLALVALSGCHSEPNAFSIDGETMGTTYTVKVVGTSAGDKSEVLAAEIDAALAEINQQMSTYLADSELTLFNRSDGLEWTDVSPATAEVVRVAREKRLSEAASVRKYGFQLEHTVFLGLKMYFSV